MVSDLVEEYGGYLRLSEEDVFEATISDSEFPAEARELLEYGEEKEGYWTSARFMAQMKKAAQIAEWKYNLAMYTLVWIINQSSCHKAFAPDALNASRMNVQPGGAQPLMRDTQWTGRTQTMVDNGVAKGLKRVLEERGINTGTMTGPDMKIILSN